MEMVIPSPKGAAQQMAGSGPDPDAFEKPLDWFRAYITWLGAAPEQVAEVQEPCVASMQMQTIIVEPQWLPDMAWSFADAAGHEHRYATGGNGAQPWLLTLRLIRNSETTDPREAVYVCKQCGEQVCPGWVWPTYVSRRSGPRTFEVRTSGEPPPVDNPQ